MRTLVYPVLFYSSVKERVPAPPIYKFETSDPLRVPLVKEPVPTHPFGGSKLPHTILPFASIVPATLPLCEACPTLAGLERIDGAEYSESWLVT